MSVESSPRPAGPNSLEQPVANLRLAVLHREHLLAAVVILLFVLLGLCYSLAVPPFETPDEVYHYAFARHLAAGNALPVMNPKVEAPWEHEGSQAPLYYWLVGRLTAPIDQSDFPQLSVRNPRANIGNPLFPGNKNFMLYSAADRPLEGSNLALHVGRWFSLLLGTLTLLLIYLTVRRLFPQSPRLALLTLLLVATIPQFTFISAALTNDNLIIAASAAVVYWLARLVRNTEYAPKGLPQNAEYSIRDVESAGGKPRSFGSASGAPVRVVDWLVLGCLLGVAALSKLQGLGLVVLSGLTILGLAWQRRDWRLPLRALLPVALPALAIAGWWYWRNYTLYGDWTGMGNLLANNGQREDPLTLTAFWREFRGLRYSYWGLFGWFNILLPSWVYSALDGITLLALVGLVWRGIGVSSKTRERKIERPESGVQRPETGGSVFGGSPLGAYSEPHMPHEPSGRALLTTWALLSLLLLLFWIQGATSSQGRLLFPAIGAVMALLVMGLDVWVSWLPVRGQVFAWLSLPALLLGSSLYTLVVLFPASYGAPAPVTALPATALPEQVVYGDADSIRLVGLEIADRRYTVGEAVPVTVYLQAPAQVVDDYQLFIQFLDDNRTEVGNLTSHPGWGRNPTSLWRSGALYADPYPVEISGPVDNWAPLLAQVYVGFVDPSTEKSGRLPIPARNAAGEEIVPFVGQIAISPATQPEIVGLTTSGAQFGNVIQLTGFHLSAEDKLPTSEPLTVTLQWDALGTPATDYSAFVHLRDASGQTVAGFDQQPAPNRFPTRYWRTGDRIVSQFPVEVSGGLRPGVYELWAGLYETASQGTLRLPVTTPAGQKTGDGELFLQELEVR